MRRMPQLAAAGVCVLALGACHGGEPRSAVAPTPATGERYVVRLQDVPDLKPVSATVTTAG
mgnify:FL=1